MVKRREPPLTGNTKREPTAEEVEAFASGADTHTIKSLPTLDPDANRDFKAIRVPFNEYEFNKLMEGAKLTGRSKLNFIRWAILKAVEEAQKKD
jgi:hypothetical protein